MQNAKRVSQRISEIYRDEDRKDTNVTDVFAGTIMAALELMKDAPSNAPREFINFETAARECLEAISRKRTARDASLSSASAISA